MFRELTSPRDVELVAADSGIFSDATLHHPQDTLVHTSVGPMDNNSWLIARSGQGLIVDAAADAEHLLALADRYDITITDVLTTHRHADHIQALHDVLEATGARHHAPRLDADAIRDAADVTVDEAYGGENAGEKLRPAGRALEAFDFRLVELRGHTPGGLALIGEVAGRLQAWVGDSVFPGGVGKTDTPEDFSQLLTDVNERIFSLPPYTDLHPGHGVSTTVGRESGKVEQWRERGW